VMCQSFANSASVPTSASAARRVVVVTKTSFLYRYLVWCAFSRASRIELVGIIAVSTDYPPSVRRAQKHAMKAFPFQLGLHALVLMVLELIARVVQMLFCLITGSRASAPELRLKSWKGGENLQKACDFMRSKECDILLSCAAPLIPKEMLEIPSIASVNMHSGFLQGHGGGSTDLSYFTDEVQRVEMPFACSMHLMVPDVDAGDLLAVHTFAKPASCLEHTRMCARFFDIAVQTCGSLTAKTLPAMRVPQLVGRVYMRKDTFERIGEVARRGALTPRAGEVMRAVRDLILIRVQALPSKSVVLSHSQLGLKHTCVHD